MSRIEGLDKLAIFTLDSDDVMSQPETELYIKELTTVLKEVRAKLTAKQQQALELSQAIDTSLHKTSQKLSCTPEALRCRLMRARKRSRELLMSFLENQ